MSRRILLADDSVTIQKVIELTFMDEDYEVTAVGNGDEAVAALGRDNPDLVIADVHMPGANGYEVCRRAKEWRPEVPVLLLVGTFEPFDEARGRDAGADSFLKKPFDSQELLQLVGRLLGPSASPETAPAAAADREEEPAWGDLALESDEPAPTQVAPPDDPFAPVGEAFHWPEETSSSWQDEPTAAMRAEDATELRPIGFRHLETTLEERVGAPQPATPSPESAAAERSEAPIAATSDIDSPFPLDLSDADVDRIARRVAELVSERVLRDVAWEVVPDMAEVVIKERLRELESEVE
ncbi:MAG TPA: response regulator [Thermoanaerobaculia bacterium]|nr:response regulator [Thermoanaerobaculia bacterium]